MKNEVLTTTGAAQLCHVSRFTIRNWVESGKLKSSLTAGGHRRILINDLEKFMPEGDRTKKMVLSESDTTVKKGDLNPSWEYIANDLDKATLNLMSKLKTCNTDQLADLQAKINALEKCKHLTGKVINNLTKVKEIMNSASYK